MKFSVTSTRPVEKLRAKTLLKALPQQILDLVEDPKLLKKWQTGKKTMSMDSGQNIIWKILGTRKNQKKSRAEELNHLYMHGPRETKLWDCFTSIPPQQPALISSTDLIINNKMGNHKYVYSPLDELPQAIRNWMYHTHINHFHTESADYLLYILNESKAELGASHIDINDLIDTLKRQLIYLEDVEYPLEYESAEILDYKINKEITPIDLYLKNDYIPLNNMPSIANENGAIDDL